MNTIIAKNILSANLLINRQSNFITLLGTEEYRRSEIRTETFYRRDKISVERVIEYDAKTNKILKILYYDYFNNEKIRAIDEFLPDSGEKYRTVNYLLYKSIDEYDIKNGKRVHTINYDMKDENKITSILEYEVKTGKIIKVILFRRDGKTISSIKKINPETDQIISRKTFNEYGIISSISTYNGESAEIVYFNNEGNIIKKIYNNSKTNKLQTFTYLKGHDKIKEKFKPFGYQKDSTHNENVAKLIDSLYNKKLSQFVL